MKLNLGCGSNWKELYPDYEGLDIIDYGQKYLCDILLWDSENQYDEIMANHFLEHFDQDQLKAIFNKIHKCLKDNGIFKIVVPHQKKERAWILSHRTYWNETVANWLGEGEARDVYGFGNWKVLEVITNERQDIHIKLEAVK